MNREFLKNAGVPEEAVDKVMAEYGKDIQAEKDKTEKVKADLADRDKTIETYKAKVADLEKNAGDSAVVRKELDELKAKMESDRKAAEAKAADEQLTANIRAIFPSDKKFVNEYTEAALIGQIKAELAKAENRGKGVSDIFAALTKDKAGIFENPNQPGDMGGFGGTDIDQASDAKMRAIMGLPANDKE